MENYSPPAQSSPETGQSSNPSYQNYLANQLLLSRKSASASNAPLTKNDITSIECSEKLGSLLDVIDSVKQSTQITNNITTTSGHITSDISDISSPYDWIRHFDATHGQYYYYNYKTGVSQWEKPEDFIEPVVMTSSLSSLSSASIQNSSSQRLPALSGEASTGYAATFNTRTSTFATSGGPQSYFDTVGRPTDREGRQLAGKISSHNSTTFMIIAFFNLNDLERNREEAKMRKKQLQVLTYLTHLSDIFCSN